MLLDSNIIIYSAQPKYKKLLDFLFLEKAIEVSIISKIEVLGYNKLTEFDRKNFEAFFNTISISRLNDEIANLAIDLKQLKKISLGDAIIAATALNKNIPLLTNNIGDFKHIEGLEVLALDDILNNSSGTFPEMGISG